MLKIAICDDEFYFNSKFKEIINEALKNRIEKIDTYTNPKRLLKSEEIYDLIFLDIEMPEISGIEVAKHYDRNESSIIFVTNKDNLVFDAYNSTDSFGFIRKSNLEEDLQIVLDRFNKCDFRLAVMPVKNGSKIIKIRYSDITFIEKIVNNVIIHTIKGDFSERSTITEMEKQLGNHGFIRCHVGYLVNLDYVRLIDSNEIELCNSARVPISRSNVKYVKSEFLKRSVMMNV